MNDSSSKVYLTSSQVLTLLRQEVEAERALVPEGAPDPCPWFVDTRRYIQQIIEDPKHPLPIAHRGGQGTGHGHRFDPDVVRTWFAEEFERRQHIQEPDFISGVDTGILVTAGAVAAELKKEHTRFARWLTELGVQPVRQTVRGTRYYRLGHVLAAILDDRRATDPDSLPPTERDAHYRAEARKDALLLQRRDLIASADVIRALNALATILRDACDLIPDRLEQHLHADQAILEHVEQALDAARQEIAARVTDLARDIQAPADAPAPLPLSA